MGVVAAIKTGLYKTAEVGCRGLNYLSKGYSLIGKGVQTGARKADEVITNFCEDEAKADIGTRAGDRVADAVGKAYSVAVESAKRFLPKRIDKLATVESEFGSIQPEVGIEFQKD